MTLAKDSSGNFASAESEDDALGGEQLDAFVDAELAAERDRRDRIDARGAGLITTSAALATLMFASASLVTSQGDYAPPRGAIWSLGFTFLAFAFAAWSGLLATRSENVEVVTTRQMLGWKNDDERIWRNTKDNVRWVLVRAKIVHLDSLRAGNTKRSKWATRGGVGQLIAFVGLLAAVAVVFVDVSWPHTEGFWSILAPIG